MSFTRRALACSSLALVCAPVLFAAQREADPIVSVHPGTAPLILSAPHGGGREPEGWPERTGDTLVRDTRTSELAFAIADAFEAEWGARPWIVLNHARRSLFDPNRGPDDPLRTHEEVRAEWLRYHDALTEARADVAHRFGRGLLLDLHGHGHDDPRIELGYALSIGQLATSDAELSADAGARAALSVRALAARSPRALAEIVRGPSSLGGLLEAEGFLSVPSPSRPDPGDAPYFDGGYITRAHGSRAGGSVDAVQLEFPIGMRGRGRISRTAGAVARAVRGFLELHYALAPGRVPLRFDQIQVVGTHNSYHLPPRGGFGALGDGLDDWGYAHRPLGEQLEQQGMRHFELDVWADPDGGLFDERTALGADPGASVPELLEPGFKVLHVPEFDWRTNHYTLRDALRAVRDWSDRRPGHLPIVLLLELKDAPARFNGQTFGSFEPLRYDADRLHALEAEIRDELPPARLFTPDDLRGHYDTIAEAREARGWPALDALRGKILFALDNMGSHKRLYLETFPDLRDGLLFVDSRPGDPHAAFAKRNGPNHGFEEIQRLVGAGFLVRTRADSGTKEARTGETRRRDRALASGAQLVSTDYPVPDPALGTGYAVQLPGGAVARLNPVSGAHAERPEVWEPVQDAGAVERAGEPTPAIND